MSVLTSIREITMHMLPLTVAMTSALALPVNAQNEQGRPNERPAMTRLSTLGRLLLAVGVSGAAIIGLATHAFVRKWEPAPTGLPL